MTAVLEGDGPQPGDACDQEPENADDSDGDWKASLRKKPKMVDGKIEGFVMKPKKGTGREVFAQVQQSKQLRHNEQMMDKQIQAQKEGREAQTLFIEAQFAAVSAKSDKAIATLSEKLLAMASSLFPTPM
jgi:hypothetical protein